MTLPDAGDDDDETNCAFEDLLPSPDAGPEALYARAMLLEELESAVDELPAEQREVFIAHELEGRSFKEIAAETGVRREYPALAQTLCGAASARAIAKHLRRIYENEE